VQRFCLLINLIPFLVWASQGEVTVVPQIFSPNTCMNVASPLHCAKEQRISYGSIPSKPTLHFPAVQQITAHYAKPTVVAQYTTHAHQKMHYYLKSTQPKYYRTTKTNSQEYKAPPRKLNHYRMSTETEKYYYNQPKTSWQYHGQPLVSRSYYSKPQAAVMYRSIAAKKMNYYSTAQVAQLSQPTREYRYHQYAPNGYRIRYWLPGHMAWRHCSQESTAMVPMKQ